MASDAEEREALSAERRNALRYAIIHDGVVLARHDDRDELLPLLIALDCGEIVDAAPA